MRFDDHEEFFNAVGDSSLHPTSFGECFWPFTVEEMYQHFKERYDAEKDDLRALLATQSASTAPGQAEGIVLTEFMQWAIDNLGQGYSLEREDGTFVDPVTRWAFAAWRASGKSAIAALSKEKPQ